MFAASQRWGGAIVQTQARRWATRARAATAKTATAKTATTETKPLAVEKEKRKAGRPRMRPVVAEAEPKDERLVATNKVAEQLKEEGLYYVGRGKTRSIIRDDTKLSADTKRVNLVNEGLCEDIFKYLGSSLDRHVGCDIIDINPGVGVWSKAINDRLKPENHILLEPDREVYEPYMETLLKRPGTQLIGQSGIEWKQLDEVLAMLKRQRPRQRDDPQERNDTLLMTANIAWYPNKPWPGFHDVGDLVMYQLFSSIRLQTLFQRYGQVRMLVWMRDSQQGALLPRSIKYRQRVALDGEMLCEWIRSVAEPDWAAVGDIIEQYKHKRDTYLDQKSSLDTLKRMKDAGIEMPLHRRSTWMQEMEALESQGGVQESSSPAAIQHVAGEWEDLVHELGKKGTLSGEKLERYKYLRKHALRRDREAENFGRLLDEWRQIPRRPGEESDALSKKRDAEWNAKLKLLNSRQPTDFRNIMANYHIVHQDPPMLHWDRRPYEPLTLAAEEFFPNVECCLVDIQPKALHPLQREVGAGTSRAGDMLQLMTSTAIRSPNIPVSSAFNAIYPGAGRMALRDCPSFRDPKRGGMSGTGQNELWPRIISSEQWLEFLEAYMKWPFRMSYPDMVSRMTDVIDTEIKEDLGAMGSGDK